MNETQIDNAIGNHINSSIDNTENTIGRLHHITTNYAYFISPKDYNTMKELIATLSDAADILISLQNYPIETVSDNPDNYIFPTPVDDIKPIKPIKPIAPCPGCGEMNTFSGYYCDDCTGNIAAVSGPNPQY